MADQLPGKPLFSGFRTLTDEEQEEQRLITREVQRAVAPKIESVRLARLRAAAAAQTAVIG